MMDRSARDHPHTQMLLMELKEAKQNMWKKWRTKNTPNTRKLQEPRKEALELNLKLIEKELKKLEEEKTLEKEKYERESKRREDYIREKRLKENERIIKLKDKNEKIEKKKKLEKRWEMMRWVVSFIEEHREEWEMTTKMKEKHNQESEENERWRKLDDDEKKLELKEKHKHDNLTRSEKIELAKEKRGYWVKWRGGEDALHHQDTQQAGHQIPKAGEAAQQGEDPARMMMILETLGSRKYDLIPPPAKRWMSTSKRYKNTSWTMEMIIKETKQIEMNSP